MNIKPLVCALALALPGADFGHAHLERSVPARNSTVDSSPPEVVLVFSERVGLTSLILQEQGGKAP